MLIARHLFVGLCQDSLVQDEWDELGLLRLLPLGLLDDWLQGRGLRVLSRGHSWDGAGGCLAHLFGEGVVLQRDALILLLSLVLGRMLREMWIPQGIIHKEE